MFFTLEALEAKHGDCLILHYGKPDDPRFAVIDGGPPTVYENRLQPRLAEIRKKWQDQKGQLVIDLLMVSHIDQDHVYGVTRFAKDLGKQKNDGKIPYCNILTLWHNSFDDLTGNDPDGLMQAMVTRIAAASGSAEASIAGIEDPVTRMLASVGEARELRDMAERLAIPVNTGFQHLVMAPKSGGVKKKWGDGLSLTVVGPNKERLAKLQEKWDKELKKLKKKKPKTAELDALAAEYADKTEENLSSIVVLAEAEGKRILLTGDGRGDFVLDGLEAAGLMNSAGQCPVDILKMPHHGSIRDVELDFFEKIPARHYVISADGNYGNPDNETLELLFQARPGADYKVHMTNKTGIKGLGPRIQKLLKKHQVEDKFVFRDENNPSLKVDLLDPVKY